MGNLECSVANLNTTGAMLLAPLAVAVGREGAMVLELKPTPVTLQVRVVRCEPIDVALPSAAVWRRQEHSLGVVFLQPSREALQAIIQLTKIASGVEQSSPRVLVLGEEDAVSQLIDEALKKADYIPRLLTHSGYAISTAKQIGAKAIVVNLPIDPAFSARSILDALRADPATARLPVIVCARQASLAPGVRTYLTQQRLRLLLVPFTPEELVMTIDRALMEGT